MPKLTDVTIRNLKPPARGQKTYWDNSLGVRVSQGGAKSFIIILGSGKRHTIGRYPNISLSEARTEAKRLFAERTLGKIRPTAISCQDAVKEYLSACEQRLRPRTLEDYQRLLKRLNFFGKLSDVTPHDVVRKLDALRYAPAEQNHAFVIARAFFNWCVRRHHLAESPCARMTLPTRPVVRDRVLKDGELVAVWNAAQGMFGAIVKLLILTGQRRHEIAALQWEWIDEETITLPGSLTKNGRQHTFPYGGMTRQILESLPRRNAYVFPASRDAVRGKPTTTFNGWSKATVDLRERSHTQDWTLHDLRRTFATNLAALRTPIHVTEKLLNHVSGSVSGIAAVYNRHTYIDEMTEAIHTWESKLAQLLETHLART